MEQKKDGLFKYQTLTDRERKNLAILDIIRRSGPISRTEISKMTEINIVTISNYVNNYIQNALVVEKGLDISTGGRKPTLLELNVKGGYVIGVDVGPANIIGIITDLGINKVTKVKHPRPTGHMEDVTAASINTLEELINSSNIDKTKLRGIGFGISGVLDETSGTVRDTDRSRGLTSSSYVALRTAVEQKFSINTFMGNDATCAAYGEKRLNIESDVENMLYIYSDVGCGIIIKGEIYSGAGGSAGEIQLSIDKLDKEKLTLPSDELYYLRPLGIDLGMKEEAKKVIKKGVGTKILELAKGDPEQITLDIIIKAAEGEDRVALDVIEMAGIGLGTRIAYLINLFNPEVVIIGGGVERAGELILGSVRKAVRKLAFEEAASKVRIIPSRLGEDAVAFGAVALVLREIFANL